MVIHYIASLLSLCDSVKIPCKTDYFIDVEYTIFMSRVITHVFFFFFNDNNKLLKPHMI